MKFVIVTGLSGAGKSQVVKAFEDMGNYCVDNMPPQLIPKFAEIYKKSANPHDCVAIVCDIRSGEMFKELSGSLDELAELGYEYEIMFLEASDETLIRRYKETRRSHPLANGGRVGDGIKKEHEILKELKDNASKIIDTSHMTAAQLKERIAALYGDESALDKMAINIISFGYKYGIPLDADLVFDVRFLPNPFYVPELKTHTGLETCVRDYVMDSDMSREFLNKLCDMLEFLIPKYEKEGKTQLVMGIGCTGGHHRSVTIAEEIRNALKKSGRNAVLTHRDIDNKI